MSSFFAGIHKLFFLRKRKRKKESYETGSDRVTEEREGWCSDPHVPPCAGYVVFPHVS
jgi:hypothetical protein